jgi:hypothetical protein
MENDDDYLHNILLWKSSSSYQKFWTEELWRNASGAGERFFFPSFVVSAIFDG